MTNEQRIEELEKELRLLKTPNYWSIEYCDEIMRRLESYRRELRLEERRVQKAKKRFEGFWR